MSIAILKFYNTIGASRELQTERCKNKFHVRGAWTGLWMMYDFVQKLRSWINEKKKAKSDGLRAYPISTWTVLTQKVFKINRGRATLALCLVFKIHQKPVCISETEE